MTERIATIRLQLEENGAGDRLDIIKETLAGINGFMAKAGVNIQVQGLEQIQAAKIQIAEASQRVIGSASGAIKTVQGVSSSAKTMGDEFGKAGEKGKSAFDTVLRSVNETGNSLRDAIGSLALMGTGGVILGFSTVDAAKNKLYIDEVNRVIDANKKLRISHEDLDKTAEKVSKEMPMTVAQATERLYDALQMAGQYMPKGEAGLEGAENISKLFYARQELLAQAGISDMQTLIARAVMTPGAMQGRFGAQFQAATGLTDAQMATAESRVKALRELGANVNIDEERLKRPWDTVAGNIQILKEEVGDALGGTILPLTQRISDAIDTVNKIPGGPQLIGIAAAGMAGVGALSLLMTVVKPLEPIFTILRGAIISQTLATAVSSGANAEMAGSEVLLSTAMSSNLALSQALAGTLAELGLTSTASAGGAGMLAASEEALAAAETGAAVASQGLAAGVWASLAPILAIMIPLLALGGILYLVESRTHIFSQAWAQLGRTQMAKDALGWFKELGVDIDTAIHDFDKLYGSFKSGGGLKTVIDIANQSTQLLLKPTLLMVDILSMISARTDLLNKSFEAGKGLWKNMADFLNWLLTRFGEFYSWIMTALPGAEKEQLRQELQKRLGITQKNPEGTKNFTLDQNGTLVYNPKVPGESTRTIKLEEIQAGYFNNQVEGSGNRNIPLPVVIQKAYLNYANAPSFAQGVAQAVKEGLATLPGVIGKAIADNLNLGNLKIEIPYMDKLVTTLDSLQKWLEKQGVPVENVVKSTETATNTVKENAPGFVVGGPAALLLPTFRGVSNWFSNKPEGTTEGESAQTSPVASTQALRFEDIEDDRRYKNKNTGITDFGSGVKERLKIGGSPDDWQAYAQGATFRSRGPFFGIVDPTEEIIPQSVAQVGPGPISRALDFFNKEVDNDMFDSISRASYSNIGPSSINAPVHVEINIEKVGDKETADYFTEQIKNKFVKEIDMDKLAFRFRNHADSLSTRGIARLRG